MIAEEIIREKIFLAMRQEIPFSTAVQVEQFIEEPERNLVKIAAVIIVERDSHKGMIIGTGGAQLKAIGTSARLELEQILGRRVFLETHVRVERGWTADPRKSSRSWDSEMQRDLKTSAQGQKDPPGGRRPGTRSRGAGRTRRRGQVDAVQPHRRPYARSWSRSRVRPAIYRARSP